MSSIERRLLALPESPTAPQVARALGVTEQTVHRWGQDGTLPRPVRLGARKTYFDREELLARLRELDAARADEPAAAS
jgi:predicted DNA-binding transcriptional regulator AlpA